MKHAAFDTYHPLVAALYFLAVLVFAMAAFQPVFVVLNLAVAWAYNILLRGWRAAAKTALWQLPLLLLIALLNPLFSATGSTVLFSIGKLDYCLEGLVYGIFMGCTLVAVMQWFSSLSHVLTSDKIMQLTGSVMPTIGLMITMILRLVPQFVSRNSSVRAVAQACTSARIEGVGKDTAGAHDAQLGFWSRKAYAAKAYLRDISVLMGWGMEDSLETAEAMRARGWGASPKRSTYQRSEFRVRDAFIVIIMAILIAGSAFLAWVACSQFEFYPQLTHLRIWWGYAPYLLFLLIPFILEIKERIAWRA